MDMIKMVEELERDEGLRLKPYLDSVGAVTIGIGRNLRDVGISKDEAYHMLHNDLERVQADLDHHLPWWRKLSEVRQRVLANMCFNLGIASLLQFRTTLGAVQMEMYDQAAKSMLNSKWAEQVGPRAVRLAELMRTGQEK